MKRNWFFFALSLFPLVFVCLAAWGGLGTTTPDISFCNSAAIYNILTEIVTAAGFGVPSFVLQYVSYLIVVLFLHICYDAITFIPNFLRGCFERWTRV